MIDWIVAFKNIQVLISETCESLKPYMGNEILQDSEMGKLFWIIQVGPKCNHKCPIRRGQKLNNNIKKQPDSKMSKESEYTFLWRRYTTNH